MKITLLSFGTYLDKNYKIICEEFEKRLGHYYRFKHILIDPRKKYKSKEITHRKAVESDLALSHLTASDYVVLFDERGKQFTSLQWAEHMNSLLQRSHAGIVFIIGGAYGFHTTLYERADARCSLSTMTMNHQIVRIMCLEQIYRAATILKGESYHNE